MPRTRPKSISRQHSSQRYNPDECEITPLVRRTTEREAKLAYRRGKIVGAALGVGFMVLVALFVFFWDRIFWESERGPGRKDPVAQGVVGELFRRFGRFEGGSPVSSSAADDKAGLDAGVSAILSRIVRVVERR